MRLGGPVLGPFPDPASWIGVLRAEGYSAAYCPLSATATPDQIRAFTDAARAANVLIAEVGAWSNPLDRDDARRRDAIRLCQQQLALAERVGARCCVNIAGSRSPQWDGPDPDNLSPATFDLIVATVREIIDAIKPQRTCYTLETMPWICPDSPESYLRLIRAIDRPAFAVHLDVVNLINSPQRFFDNAAFIRACFAALGPHIRSCHAKDIALAPRLTVHLDEARPGLGGLDYRVFLTELSKLPGDIPLMLEHLPQPEDYRAAAVHLRQVAAAGGLKFT